jgi:hypothetical protein
VLWITTSFELRDSLTPLLSQSVVFIFESIHLQKSFCDWEVLSLVKELEEGERMLDEMDK